jgi:O-acetylhomoserine (thiol)-lyase
VVWHSTTKWIHGSGTTIGGVLIDGGTFPWEDGDYPEIAGENPAYHGVNFRERFGDAAFAAAVRFRALRSLGDAQAPFDAWQTLQGLETLPLRMERHSENALAVARYLADHEAVSWVAYPGLEGHETHDTASRLLDGGYGGMISFGLEAGYEAGKRVAEATDLASFLANVGDAKTLVIHPASTTHQQLSAAEQRASGVTPDLLRLSVGIEDATDIVADLDQAIEAATGT